MENDLAHRPTSEGPVRILLRPGPSKRRDHDPGVGGAITALAQEESTFCNRADKARLKRGGGRSEKEAEHTRHLDKITCRVHLRPNRKIFMWFSYHGSGPKTVLLLTPSGIPNKIHPLDLPARPHVLDAPDSWGGVQKNNFRSQ